MLDGGLQGLGREQLKQARGAARAAVDALMLSDAPLLFPPGQLALAAMRSGFNKARSAARVCGTDGACLPVPGWARCRAWLVHVRVLHGCMLGFLRACERGRAVYTRIMPRK